MGALHKRYWVKCHQLWRLLTSSCLQGGVFHIIISLSGVIFVGIHLEQEFGPSLLGSLVAALFLQDRASVTSSGALFGLLGAFLSGLIRNWKIYSKKFATLVLFFIILTLNTIFGLMLHVNNFSNIGGFISGFLTGFMLLFKPEFGKLYRIKGFLIDCDAKSRYFTYHYIRWMIFSQSKTILDSSWPWDGISLDYFSRVLRRRHNNRLINIITNYFSGLIKYIRFCILKRTFVDVIFIIASFFQSISES